MRHPHVSVLCALIAATLGTAAAQAQTAERRTRNNALDGLTYVWIEPGEFAMGCAADCEPREMPSHRVLLSKGFWMAATEVPVGAFKRFADATHASMPAEPDFRGRLLNPRWADDLLPMIDVT
ncbi:MAG: SUMF1/EgtB/PvdO family nonheme iron enzyme, partial [Vicinamibacterales bacterium]